MFCRRSAKGGAVDDRQDGAIGERPRVAFEQPPAASAGAVDDDDRAAMRLRDIGVARVDPRMAEDGAGRRGLHIHAIDACHPIMRRSICTSFGRASA